MEGQQQMNKHTPGPWGWHWNKLPSGEADGRVHTINPSFVGTVNCIAVSPRYQTQKQWEADASLLAAAPDLLEALKAVVAVADRKTVEFDRARAAIAKAEMKD